MAEPWPNRTWDGGASAQQCITPDLNTKTGQHLTLAGRAVVVEGEHALVVGAGVAEAVAGNIIVIVERMQGAPDDGNHLGAKDGHLFAALLYMELIELPFGIRRRSLASTCAARIRSMLNVECMQGAQSMYNAQTNEMLTRFHRLCTLSIAVVVICSVGFSSRRQCEEPAHRGMRATQFGALAFVANNSLFSRMEKKIRIGQGGCKNVPLLPARTGSALCCSAHASCDRHKRTNPGLHYSAPQAKFNFLTYLQIITVEKYSER